jgi:hypothetical protein
MAVERAKYSVEISEPPCEIRVYAASVVAAVRVGGSRQAAVSAGFRILADYIFGNNAARAGIAMTAPVTQSAVERASMTAPVEQGAVQGGWVVRVTLPAGYTRDGAPAPHDSRVTLLELPARRMAAVTFSGFWSDSNLQEHQAQLGAFLRRRGLTAVSGPVYAFYDPPWTPWFMRTNEVLVEISASGR